MQEEYFHTHKRKTKKKCEKWVYRSADVHLMTVLNRVLQNLMYVILYILKFLLTFFDLGRTLLTSLLAYICVAKRFHIRL